MMQQDLSQRISVLHSIPPSYEGRLNLSEKLDYNIASDIVDIENGMYHRHQNHRQKRKHHLENIVKLNKQGLSFFESSHYGEAVHCFKSALHQLEQSSSFQHYAVSTDTTINDATVLTHFLHNNNHHHNYSTLKHQPLSGPGFPSSSFSYHHHHQQQQQQLHRKLTMRKQAVPLSLSTSSAEKVQPKNEYDEGMNMFPLPLRLDISLLLQQEKHHTGMKRTTTDDYGCHTIASAVLLYNIGQGLLRFHQKQRNSEALDCFYQALFLAKRNSSVFSSSFSNAASLDKKRDYSQRYQISPLKILHNIGFLQFRNGDYEEAIATFNEALKYCSCRNQRQQPKHTSTTSSKLDVAATLNCLGVLYFYLPEADTTKSLGYLLRAFSLRMEILGHRESRNIATNLNNIGRVYYIQGKYDDALRFYEEALRIRRHVLGSGSLDVAATISNAGQTFHHRGELDQALRHYQEFLQIAIPKLGKTHHDVAIMYRCMAQIYHERNEYEGAISLYKKALIAVRENFGLHHAEVASILNKMGNLFYENDNLKEAIHMYQEGLIVERKVLSRCHPNISVTLSNIGQIYKQRGEYSNALKMYEEALSIQLKSLGKSNLNVAITLSNMGLIHYHNKNFADALELFQEALRIRRDVFGDGENLEVASSLNSIGLVLFKLGMHTMAIQSFLESLRLRRSLLGPSHRDVAIIIYNIATIYMELGNEDEALKFYMETLRVEKQVLGPNHTDVILTIQCIAQVHQQRGDVDEVLQCYNEILRIQRLNNHVNGINPSLTSSTLGTYDNRNNETIDINAINIDGNNKTIDINAINIDGNNNNINYYDNNNSCNMITNKNVDITEIARTLQSIANIYLQIGDAERVVEVMSEAVRAIRKSGRNEEDILNLSGFHLYSIAKLHPDCAAVA